MLISNNHMQNNQQSPDKFFIATTQLYLNLVPNPYVHVRRSRANFQSPAIISPMIWGNPPIFREQVN
jgi:hypothetical protein